MALNVANFKIRALTALVFVLIMLSGLCVHLYLFVSLFSIVMIGGLYEFGKIIRLIQPTRYFLFLPLGFLYIAVPCLLMILLGIELSEAKGIDYNPVLPCVVMFSIWINDTMAYLVGSFIGKTPFSKISPKKTWEGTIGGAILCVALVTVFSTIVSYTRNISWHHWLIISSICAVMGTLGDLLESKLKRLANIKDSGTFMPGHGGFLDRFDSMLLATPFVWIYMEYFFK